MAQPEHEVHPMGQAAGSSSTGSPGGELTEVASGLGGGEGVATFDTLILFLSADDADRVRM